MWIRHSSRSTGAEYLYNPSSGETKWPEPPEAAAAYDTAASLPAPTVPESGASLAMRRAHNLWKQAILGAYVKPGDRVVDLACNRGGDLHKFLHAGARSYVGVDVSPASTAEATRRSLVLPSTMRVKVHVCDLAHERLPCESGTVDVASCMFALHYLAASRDAMATCLAEVKRVLRPGGTFVATFPDHARVRAVLAGSPVADHLRVHGAVPDDARLVRAPWGHPYTFEYVGRTPPLREFVVFPPALEDLAAALGLRLVRRTEPPAGSEFYTARVFVAV
jgi:mRNA (guanine-N7-)-methyltransferase